MRHVLILSVLLVVAACASSAPDEWRQLGSAPPDTTRILRFTGTVRYLDIEGGVHVIVDAQGTRFTPSNLPSAFSSDGTRVDVEAVRQTDMVSTTMVGPLVELIRIRQLPDQPVQ